MKQAEAFAEGDASADSLTSQSLRMPAPTPERAAGSAPPSMDPVLADIFVKEMRGHVKVVREFIERAAQRPERHPVDEPLYRACHTLLGSGRMAGFEPAIALAGPLAEHSRRHFDAGTSLTNEGVEALRAAAVEIERMADALVAGSDYSLSPKMPGALSALANASGAQPTAAPRAAPLYERRRPHPPLSRRRPA
jgi:chemotaxis protein histidine kinase CheA